MEVYTGAKHGFAMTDFPVYDRAAAEKHWDRVLGLFEAVGRPGGRLPDPRGRVFDPRGRVSTHAVKN